MRFNKSKCKVLHLWHGYSHYQYKLRDERIEHCPAKKDLAKLENEKIDTSEQCALTALLLCTGEATPGVVYPGMVSSGQT